MNGGSLFPALGMQCSDKSAESCYLGTSGPDWKGLSAGYTTRRGLRGWGAGEVGEQEEGELTGCLSE